MRKFRFQLAVMALAAASAAPALAQDFAPARPLATPAPMAPLAGRPDSNVEPFYAARPGTLIWLGDAGRRAAAAKLPELLRRSPVDGLAEGPALAASVEAALARNPAPAVDAAGLAAQQADDKIISTAWVRYAQALNAPVAGVSYGDPARALRMPTASAVLIGASAAPSLTTLVERTAAVNPFYASLRDTALRNGSGSDPRVRATLDRLRLVPASGRVILVDVANAQLMMLEDGRVVDTMKTVVGKPDFPTPLLAGTVHYVTLNPYWHIPQDVARRKVAPVVVKRGVSYLTAARYQTVAAFGGDKEVAIDPTTVDWKAVAKGDVEVNIRQLTGPNNMMGKMKFGFVNDYGIFLHDTPHKDFFLKAKRNLSLGCVRLEHPAALATWLLGREPAPSGDDAEQNVQLTAGVPIFISYLTARPDGDKLAFAPDVYGLDGKPAATKVAAAAATGGSAQR
ncbi:MAG: L,D-transpeptidase family protein [Sphingomicrobium sp.]